MKMNFKLYGILFGFYLTFSPFSIAEDSKITKQLQDQLEKTKSTFGELKPFQEEIFNSEVLQSTGRFIKDYSQKNGKITNIVVDESGLKRFLAFHTSVSGVTGESKKLLLSLYVEGDCQSCVTSLQKIKQEWKERLERRGLSVIVLNAEESKKDPIDLLSAKNAGSWLKLKIVTENDLDHVGESIIHAKIDLKFPSTSLSAFQREVEVPPRDSIDQTLGRLFIEGLTSLGADTLKLAESTSQDEEGFKVSVKNIKSYNELLEMKRNLASLTDQVKVVEYQLSKDRTEFAVYPIGSKKMFLQKLKESKIQIAGDESGSKIEIIDTKKNANGETP